MLILNIEKLYIFSSHDKILVSKNSVIVLLYLLIWGCFSGWLY